MHQSRGRSRALTQLLPGLSSTVQAHPLGISRQRREHGIEPLAEGPLVLHVSIYSRAKSLGPQFSQPPIKILATLAELLVTGIAQRQNRKPELRQNWRLLALQKIPEGGRVVWRITIAKRAGEEEQMPFRLQALLWILGHVNDGRR